MFDVAPTELLLVAIVALVVIGPKDLPKALRFVGHWVGKARGVARQFRSGFDSMVREAELADMEKQWAEENARIMREHPVTPATDAQAALPAPDQLSPAEPEMAQPESSTASEGEATYHFEPDPYSREPVFDAPHDNPPPETAPAPVIRPAFSDRTGGAA